MSKLSEGCACGAVVEHELGARDASAGVTGVEKQCGACGRRVRLAVPAPGAERTVTNVDRGVAHPVSRR